MVFDLENDIGERESLAARRPETLEELRAAYDAWDAEMSPSRWVHNELAFDFEALPRDY
jgi:hypothetical protein